MVSFHVHSDLSGCIYGALDANCIYKATVIANIIIIIHLYGDQLSVVHYCFPILERSSLYFISLYTVCVLPVDTSNQAVGTGRLRIG